jgi:hypothetical protein
MATIDQLCDSEALVRIELELLPRELPCRRLFGTKDFITWLENKLPNLERIMPHDVRIHGSLTPLEQVYAMFAEYVSGEMFPQDRRFKKLNRTPDFHVWEMRTDDVRIFGWVPKKDVFICCFGDGKDKIALLDSYGVYMAKTYKVREELDLDEPKVIVSRKYEDVISD